MRADHLKTLPDGSTCHPSLFPPGWWLERLLQLYHVKNFGHGQGELYFTGIPRAMNGEEQEIDTDPQGEFTPEEEQPSD